MLAIIINSSSSSSSSTINVIRRGILSCSHSSYIKYTTPITSLAIGTTNNKQCQYQQHQYQYQRNMSSNNNSSNIINNGVEVEYKKEIDDILIDYDERKKRRQSMIGTVVSTKCSKSISVLVAHQKFFPKYNKYISRHKKVMAHDEEEICEMGDTVRIVPCRPMSRMKRHSIIDILRKAPKLD